MFKMIGYVMGMAFTFGNFAGFATAAEQDQPWRIGVFVTSNGGRGVKILEVYDNSPAEALGLVPGQIIWSVNGQKCSNATMFRRQIFQSGDRVSLIILEAGFWYRITARLSTPGVASAGAGARAEPPTAKSKETLPFKDIQKKRISNPENRP
jgi:C-terminal processing protease CtpA/Prc